MWTPEFSRFVAPARAKASLWRLLGGAVTVVAVYFVGILAILGGVWALVGNSGLNGWMQRIAAADTPTAVLVMLGTFVGMFGGTLVAVRLLHKRGPGTLLGEGLIPGFVLGTGVAALVFALGYLIPMPFDLVRNVPWDIFLTFLPLALLGLLLQTGAEEVLFRGYLQQQLAARFEHWAVWMIVPALAFGALHFDPVNAGPNAIWLVAAATLFGLVAADLTRITGNIGAAWGVHFANNAAAILIVALNGSLSGMSLWKTPFTAADTGILRPLIVADMLTTLIVWALLRLVLARRQPLAT